MEIKGENVRKVISGSRNQSAPAVYGSEPPLAQHHNKRRQAGAREPTFAVPIVPSQTLTT
jgi:hypothetical protein